MKSFFQGAAFSINDVVFCVALAISTLNVFFNTVSLMKCWQAPLFKYANNESSLV